jgi:hypothetical protein
MSSEPNSVKRSVNDVTTMIVWPRTRLDWDGLPALVRNRVRDLIDEANDLVDFWSHQEIGWEYQGPIVECRKCGGSILVGQYRFGSPESGWEHMEGECDERQVQ